MGSEIPKENVAPAPVRKTPADDFTLTADEQAAFKKWRRGHFLTRSPEKLIWYAAEEGKTAFVKHLVSQGYGGKSLLKAARKGKETIAGNLVEAGVSIDDVRDSDGDTPLNNAALRGHTKIVTLLIKAGADLSIQGNSGYTALIWVAWRGTTKIVKALIESGADVDVQSESGYTALMCATICNHKDITTTLIKAGAKLDIQNKDNNTALILAAINGDRREIITALIEAGADPDILGQNGRTAMEWAKYHSRWDDVRVLTRILEEKKAGAEKAEEQVQQANGWSVFNEEGGRETVTLVSYDEQRGLSISDIFDFSARRLLTIITSEGNQFPPVEKPFSEVDPDFLKQAERKRKSMPEWESEPCP